MKQNPTNIFIALTANGVALLVASVLIWTAPEAFAQSHLPLVERRGVFPDGQEWQITVPANWNGTVINDLDRVRNPRPGRAELLLQRGFAYTGTLRHPDRYTNWNPRAESNNMVKVLDVFKAEFGQPEHVIQFGCSGGGSVGLSVAEDHPDRFDGVIALHASTPITTANMRLDLTFALKILLDPDDQLPLITTPESTAAADTAWVNAFTAAQATAKGRARMALAGVLAQYAAWGSDSDPVPKPDPEDKAAVQDALLKVVVDAARRAVTARPQWDQVAGQVSWNTGIDYRRFYENADPNHLRIVQDMYEQAELDIEADLDRINAGTRITATQEAVNYWRSRTHTGAIGVPVLQISTIGDARTPAANMTGYQALVTRAGKNALYRQAFIDAPGHCTFNTAEMAAAVATLIQRIERGTWDDITDPDKMNALGRSFGLGEPRFVTPGPEVGWTQPRVLNRVFFPDSLGPSAETL